MPTRQDEDHAPLAYASATPPPVEPRLPRRSFRLSKSNRWIVAYVVASYCAGAVICVAMLIAEQGNNEPKGSAFIILLAMPAVFPFFMLLAPGAIASGLKESILTCAVVATFVIVFVLFAIKTRQR